ncbi:hypothetical protein [Priestia koreensis]|uniref:hypothetical protein n=1 Tax=Priestia koreensis TaxID=284581 RepID=UPI00301A03AB
MKNKKVMLFASFLLVFALFISAIFPKNSQAATAEEEVPVDFKVISSIGDTSTYQIKDADGTIYEFENQFNPSTLVVSVKEFVYKNNNREFLRDYDVNPTTSAAVAPQENNICTIPSNSNFKTVNSLLRKSVVINANDPGGGGATGCPLISSKKVTSGDFYTQSAVNYIIGSAFGLVGGPYLAIPVGVANALITPSSLVGWRIDTYQCVTKLSDFPNAKWKFTYTLNYYDKQGRFQGGTRGSYITPPY